MFATDYPWENSAEAVACLEAAPVADTIKEKIFKFNAERVFSL
jgi:predicted TIM-barrel fold metal-dependent hydrolase